jgi:hypothetical protein
MSATGNNGPQEAEKMAIDTVKEEGGSRKNIRDDTMETESENVGATSKRKAVDAAFERLFGYQWGSTFDLDEGECTSSAQQLVQIFGVNRTARILGSRGISSSKRQKVEFSEPLTKRTINKKDSQLPLSSLKNPTTVTETKKFAGQAIQSTRKHTENAPVKAITARSKLDNVLAQLSGPAKMSTVQKTSDDWENFKESDKQLQDELEKKAQGKDAFLVKQDFLNRVDQRTFELEKEKRERERAKRATT